MEQRVRPYPGAPRPPLPRVRRCALGILTPAELRGRRFRRLFTDVYVAADVLVDLALRSRAAHLLVAGRGALAGYSAAELLRASCGPDDAPAEVAFGGGFRLRQPDLLVHRGVPDPDEVEVVGDVVVTTALRTAYDLARRVPQLVEAVVALDALARRGGFDPDAVLPVRDRHPKLRGNRRLRMVVRLADPLAGSPMETRTRLALVLHGLPAPVSQFEVRAEGRRYLLDLAYPEYRLAVEYDGGCCDHSSTAPLTPAVAGPADILRP